MKVGPFECGKTFKDLRDNNTYATGWIDEEGGHDLEKPGTCWLAENLRFDTHSFFSSGYKDMVTNCDSYGIMYTGTDGGTSIMNTIAPNGWHVATQEEWAELLETYGFVGNNSSQGTSYPGNTAMLAEGGNAGLEIKFGGKCDNDEYEGITTEIGLWASQSNAHYCTINQGSGIDLFITAVQVGGPIERKFYVRCIKDE